MTIATNQDSVCHFGSTSQKILTGRLRVLETPRRQRGVFGERVVYLPVRSEALPAHFDLAELIG